MGRLYGYARVSSSGQSLGIQEAALMAAGCVTVFAEKVTGTTATGREELERVLKVIDEGDQLVVTRIDRLARSVADLESIVARLKAKGTKDGKPGKGATLRATEQSIDTATPEGTAFLQMLGVFAQFETAIRKERQMEGIAKAKKAGVYKGRPAKISPAEIARLKAEGLGATEIAKRLGVGRASVYRLMADTV